jgi:hypothetical protein
MSTNPFATPPRRRASRVRFADVPVDSGADAVGGPGCAACATGVLQQRRGLGAGLVDSRLDSRLRDGELDYRDAAGGGSRSMAPVFLELYDLARQCELDRIAAAEPLEQRGGWLGGMPGDLDDDPRGGGDPRDLLDPVLGPALSEAWAVRERAIEDGMRHCDRTWPGYHAMHVARAHDDDYFVVDREKPSPPDARQVQSRPRQLRRHSPRSPRSAVSPWSTAHPKGSPRTVVPDSYGAPSADDSPARRQRAAAELDMRLVSLRATATRQMRRLRATLAEAHDVELHRNEVRTSPTRSSSALAAMTTTMPSLLLPPPPPRRTERSVSPPVCAVTEEHAAVAAGRFVRGCLAMLEQVRGRAVWCASRFDELAHEADDALALCWTASSSSSSSSPSAARQHQLSASFSSMSSFRRSPRTALVAAGALDAVRAEATEVLADVAADAERVAVTRTLCTEALLGPGGDRIGGRVAADGIARRCAEISHLHERCVAAARFAAPGSDLDELRVRARAALIRV